MTPRRRRILLSAALALLLLLLLGGAFAWHTWNKATALPDWYDASAQAQGGGGPRPQGANPPLNPQPPPRQGPPHPHQPGDGSHVQPRPQGPMSQTLDAQRMQELVAPTIAATLGAPDASGIVKATRASIQDGVLDLGVVVDVGAIPVDQLQSAQRQAVEQALNAFPAFKDKEVFLGVEGPVSIDEGYVQLGEGTRVKVGDLELDPQELAGMLGQEDITVWLQVRYQDRDVRRVTFDGDQARIDFAR